MLYSSSFIALMGSIPPVQAGAGGTITLNPTNPGDLGIAPQYWSTEVTATGGLTQVKWLVGINGAKTIEFPYNAPDNTTVPNYNHGDTINFTGYGTGFTFAREGTTGNNFRAQGSNGFDLFTVPGETDVADIRYTIDGAGGTGPIAYTVANLTAGKVKLTPQFTRRADTLVVKSTDETSSAVSGAVVFGGTAVRRITIFPHGPGDLVNAPASWTTNVSATGMTQVKWIVLDSNFVGSGMTEFVVVDLVNGTATITCNFLKAGDILVVKNADETVEDVSDPASFSGVAKSISLNPANPGDLVTPPKNWTTTATGVGLSQVKWAVFDNANTANDAWVVQNLSGSGETSITATFTEANEKLVVKSMDDLVQAVSGNVSFSSVAPTSSTDYQFVYDFRKDLTVGVNIERNLGEDASLDQAYFTRLKNNGVTHIRFFIMAKPSFGYPSDAAIRRYFDRCSAAIAAGLKIQTIDCLDWSTLNDAADSRALPFIKQVATIFKERNFDPRKIAIGAINEYEAENNAAWNGYRESFGQAIRDIIGPNYILSTGSAYWKDPNHMTDGSMTLIPGRTLYDWHIYPWNAHQAGDAASLKTMVEAWEAENNVVSICGEYALNARVSEGNWGVDPQYHPDTIFHSSREYGQARMTYWTITNGTHWRMNNDNNHELTTDIANALKSADTYIRGRSWFNT